MVTLRHSMEPAEPSCDGAQTDLLSYCTVPRIRQGYAILVREEFSCLEFIMNRDTINWILK